MISPIEECAREYWPKLTRQHKKYHSGWDIPEDWKCVSPDTRIITMSHIIMHATSKYKISLEDEHALWTGKKCMAGYRKGEYNPKEKMHPYLERFDLCPGNFQEITFFFCDTARKWSPIVLEYLEEINS